MTKIKFKQVLLVLIVLFICTFGCVSALVEASIIHDMEQSSTYDRLLSCTSNIDLTNSSSREYYDYNRLEDDNIEDSIDNDDVSGKHHHNTNDQSSVSKEVVEQSYVILDQQYNHEIKFQKRILSSEYEDILYDRRPLADIFVGFVWKKMQPVAHALTSTICKRVDHVVKQCQSNCHCAWTAIVTQKLLGNKESKLNTRTQCKSQTESSYVSTSTYDSFIHNIIYKAKKMSDIQLSLSVPLIPIIDIGRFDTSIENVEFEDQICFRLIQNSIDFFVGKVMDTFEKHSPVPEVSRLQLDRYAHKVKNVNMKREERARVRRGKLQLS